MESIINPLIYGMRLLLVESAHIFCDEMELNVYDAEDAILHGTKNCIIDNVFEPTACNSYAIIGGYRTHHEWEYTDWQEKIYEVIEKCLNLELITWWNLATPNEYKSHNRHDVINKWFYVYVNETDMLRSCLRNV